MERTIIDVSKYQGVINWDALKNSIDGAIIKCCGGYDLVDPQFDRNVSECERLGIPWGVYLYSYALNTEDALKEAETAIRLIGSRKPQYPVFFDSEQNSVSYPTYKNAAACAKVFCDAIKSAGFIDGVYASASWWRNHLVGVEPSAKWVASWGTNNGKPQNNYKPDDCDIWQYTSMGIVDGFNGRVDLNICYTDYERHDDYDDTTEYINGVSCGNNGVPFTSDQSREYACMWEKYEDGRLKVYIRDYFNPTNASSRSITVYMPHTKGIMPTKFIDTPIALVSVECAKEIRITISKRTDDYMIAAITNPLNGSVPRTVVNAEFIGHWK